MEQRGAWRWRYVPDTGEASEGKRQTEGSAETAGDGAPPVLYEGYASTRDDALQAIGAAAAAGSLRPGERRVLLRSRWGGPEVSPDSTGSVGGRR